MPLRQKIQHIRHLLAAKIKGVLFFIDRSIHTILSAVLRRLYRVKIFRPFVKKVHNFTQRYQQITSFTVVAVLVLSVTVPVLQIIAYNRQYTLSSQARTLLGESYDNLSKKITYDEHARLYQFNKDAKKDATTQGNPLAKLQSQVGGAGEKDEQQYSIDMPQDLSKGITYYDNQKELSFRLVPEFTTRQGGLREGHLIYPLKEKKGQVAYTVTNSGLKENIILYKSPGDTFKTSYSLDLPKSLEAKLIPETGEIGIYSADPALFGNISYGSSDDQARVESARDNSKKDYLTFKIPAPVVMGLNGNDQSTVAPVKSAFSLQNNILTVTTTGLEKADYPLAIDPSVSIDSTTDFQTGNQEDNNASIDSGTLQRSPLSGGTVGNWTNNSTNMPSTMYYHSSVAYNGYLYTIAGSSVRYAPISSNGSVGSWTSAVNLTGGEYYAAATVYNGYLYVSGGGVTPTANMRYAKINSDGSLGSWQSTTNLTEGRTRHQAVAYNGYMYVLGGERGNGGGSPVSQTFNYTGGQQTYTVPAGVTSVTIDARGASGGPSDGWNGEPGKGGRIQTTLSVTPGQTLYVYVGGEGGAWGSPSGGYNGGGVGGITFGLPGMPGGGASDVRQGGTALANRVVVAGGGGGGGSEGFNRFRNGGGGGGTIGQSGDVSGGGGGGTQSAGGAGGVCSAGCSPNPTAGSLGQGGNGGSEYEDSRSGGGGGGYYGGGGGGAVSSYAGGGGGGSSYAGSGTSSTTHAQGYQTGNGQVIITTATSAVTNTVEYAPINANGTLGSWVTTSGFTNARENHRAVAYNGYMYILGGAAGSTQYNDVQYALINTDGTLGSWAATTSFTTARSHHSVVISRGYVYVLGGNTTNLNDVQYAPINANGTIGAWNTTTAFNTGRMGHTSVVYGNYIYVIGGDPYASVGDKIQYASLNPPGATSSYKTNATSFTTVRQELSAAVVNNYIYMIGGQDQTGTTGGYYNDVQYAPINADGSVGAWNSTTGLPARNAHHELVVYDGRLYVIGGYNATDLGLASVAYAQPASNGTIASWATSSLPIKRYWHAATAYNGYMYVLGGTDGTTAATSVRYAAINANGSLGFWSTTTSYSTSRTNHSATVYNGYMYVAGGTGTASVEYALICTGTNSGVGGCSSTPGTLGTWAPLSPLPVAASGLTIRAVNGYIYLVSIGSASTYRAYVNTDGTLGAWQGNPSLPGARAGSGVAVGNGNIYVLGGNNNSTTMYNSVLYAQINNGGGGAVTGWTSSGTTFTNARYNHASVAYNGYLYIIGGFNVATHYADVQKAQILDNGSLGAWASGGASLPSARSGIAAVAYNGYMYVLGGKNSSGYLDEVQRAPIDKENGTIGTWTADASFSGARHATAAVAYNGYMYIMGGNDAGPQTTTFDYTGTQQTYTVPAGVTSVRISAQGADGGGLGYYSYDVGGSGAYAEADLSVTPGETLYVQVGGNGSTNGGYNGGGNTTGDLGVGYTFIGGGASDVRQGGTALTNRKVIAAGGGGAGGSPSYYGAYGGGGGDASYAYPGSDSSSGLCTGGGGATSATGGTAGTVQPIGDTEQPGQPGALGVGGAGGDVVGGGGGGGYYGGGGGGGWQLYGGCGGGGGTSYVGTGTSNAYIYAGGDGYGYGQDGQVSITYGKLAYNDVQVAKINSNGTLGAWNTTSSMKSDRTLHRAVAVNGYMYAIGGAYSPTGGSGVVHRSIEYAQINSDGTLGTWNRTSDMMSQRLNATVVVINGYLYAAGGHSGAGFLTSVEYAPINANGTIGNWQSTLSMGSIRSTESQGGASYNGRIYVTGGYNGVSSALNTTEYTSVQSIPRKTAYSKTIDLGTTSNVTGISYAGSIKGTLKLRYKVAKSDGVFGAYKTNGSFSCAEADAGRYVQIFLTLDDEANSIFVDDDGFRSILDSVTVDSVPFAAPTEKRLRHGAFFQGGALQPFNTNNVQCS